MAIATGTALAIAAAASAGSGAYAAHRAGKTNDKAIAAQHDESTTAAAVERERIANEKAASERDAAQKAEETKKKWDAYQAALDADKARWGDYVRINEPNWRASSGVLSDLFGMAGMGGNAPAYVPPSQPMAGAAPPGSGVPNVPMPGGGPTSMPEGAYRPAMPSPAARTISNTVQQAAAPQRMSLSDLMALAGVMGNEGRPDSSRMFTPYLDHA